MSRIGYAVSKDGITWNRLRRPILEPSNETDSQGVEDPRVTALDGRYYMAYTAYSGNGPFAESVTPMFAVSTNLIEWERMGPLTRDEDNKDHFLLPRKINDRYIAFHRRPPRIWLAESNDLITWPEEQMRAIMAPRTDNGWDGKRIGGNGPPIETDHGWLMLYHGYNHEHIYRLGVCLLDREDPGRIINRPVDPIFEPEEPWELEGEVPNVVFSSANPVIDDVVHIYYGAADRVIGLATCDLAELIDFARFG